jgi:hypothetical protein
MFSYLGILVILVITSIAFISNFNVKLYSNKFCGGEEDLGSSQSITHHNGRVWKNISSSTVSNARILNVVFQIDARPADQGGTIFETDWIIQTVFGQHLQRPLRVHHTHVLDTKQPLMNDSIYVFLFSPKPIDLFSRLKKGGYVNFGAMHMGDESGHDTTEYYKDAWMVFRNYWKEMSWSNHVMFVPLGTKIGLGLGSPQVFLSASKRRYLANFVGSVRSNRKYMLRKLSYKRDICYIKSDRGWAAPDGLHTVLYRSILLDSKFTLAPFGNNEESLRFYEALESGSIPIVETSKHSHGDFIENGVSGNNVSIPIPRIDNWRDLDNLLRYYDERPDILDKLQKDVINWWGLAKLKFQEKIKKIVDDSFARAYH